MNKQNELFKKIDNYIKKLEKDTKESTNTVDKQKAILWDKINAQTKVITKREKDIKFIIKLANKLVTIKSPEIHNRLSTLAFDSCFSGRLCLSYEFNKKCFTRCLNAEYIDNRRGWCYSYKVMLFDDGTIFFSGPLVNKNTIDGLEKRLLILEQIPKMLDELIENLTQIVNNLDNIKSFNVTEELHE